MNKRALICVFGFVLVAFFSVFIIVILKNSQKEGRETIKDQEDNENKKKYLALDSSLILNIRNENLLNDSTAKIMLVIPNSCCEKCVIDFLMEIRTLKAEISPFSVVLLLDATKSTMIEFKRGNNFKFPLLSSNSLLLKEIASTKGKPYAFILDKEYLVKDLYFGGEGLNFKSYFESMKKKYTLKPI